VRPAYKVLIGVLAVVAVVLVVSLVVASYSSDEQQPGATVEELPGTAP
jgi:hypothetical protein